MLFLVFVATVSWVYGDRYLMLLIVVPDCIMFFHLCVYMNMATVLHVDTDKGKHFCFSQWKKNNERWMKLLFFGGVFFGWEFPLCVSLRLGDVTWMGSQHLGFKRKQQPELLSVWKSRLVLVIVNLGHLPGGISHSSNKFHKTNHKVLHCWLPLIEYWAHKHISKCLTAQYRLSDGLLPEVWLSCLFICIFYLFVFWQEASSFGIMIFRGREKTDEKKKGGSGWKADRRGLGRSAIFQQAKHKTWSLITHKTLCNPNYRLGRIIRLNKT